VSADELATHKSSTSCWVALYGVVYDFTSFLEEHPAGAESILNRPRLARRHQLAGSGPPSRRTSHTTPTRFRLAATAT